MTRSPFQALLRRPAVFRVSLFALIGAEIRFWLYQHPALRRTASVFFLWFVLLYAGATAAFAADGTGQTSGLFIPTTGIHDTHGIGIEKYMSLPLDRGDVWTPQKMWVTSMLDILWVGHIFYVAVLFALVKFLLAFEWVDFIATPLNGIAVSFQAVVTQFHWIPFALMVTAFAAGIYMLRGKFSSGLIECVMAVFIAIAATGVLANPVATITGPEGFLNSAKTWGGEIAVAITTDPGTRPDAAMSADKVLAENVIAQLVDTYVRIPAQTVTFGHVLTGDCDKVFDKNFGERNPVNVAETNVRDRVGACDKDAKEYVQSPVITKVGVMAHIQLGSFFMTVLIYGLSFYIISSVFSSLWNGLKAMFMSLVAVLPATSRTGLWRAIIGMYSACVMVIGALVLLAGYLKVLVSITAVTSRFGIVLQMSFVNISVLIFLVALWRMHRKAKESGETLAQRLGKLGIGNAADQPKSQPIRKLAERAEPWVRDAWRDARLTKAFKTRSQPQRGFPSPVSMPNQSAFTDLGERFTTKSPALALGSRVLPALTSGRGPGPDVDPGSPAPGPGGGDNSPESGGSTAAKVASGLNLVGTAAQFIPHPSGKAVATAAKIGSAAAQAKAASAPAPHPQPTAPQRITVDSRGRGSVARPLEGTIIDAPPPAPPAARSIRNAELTEKLATLRSAAVIRK
ncbi:hypothetical protein ASF98_18675 [Arthrobacter sp. Leaf337]|uniref:hypothetical protein n=1 Tax=Arthrobacter sp. Leaf337 TaxID=1736342 RepID=UPI0006F2D27F|nr:hypothetical protein [Arthrobacter sp. Leaf337]KQR80320.1 hypothetical protein ASF98_18675 [Arthrobacter sp. Leaf337]